MGLFEKAEKKPDLFVSKGHQGVGMGCLEIVVDRETGVNYIMAMSASGNAISVTPRLDNVGDYMIDEIDYDDEETDE